MSFCATQLVSCRNEYGCLLYLNVTNLRPRCKSFDKFDELVMVYGSEQWATTGELFTPERCFVHMLLILRHTVFDLQHGRLVSKLKNCAYYCVIGLGGFKKVTPVIVFYKMKCPKHLLIVQSKDYAQQCPKCVLVTLFLVDII